MKLKVKKRDINIWTLLKIKTLFHEQPNLPFLTRNPSREINFWTSKIQYIKKYIFFSSKIT